MVRVITILFLCAFFIQSFGKLFFIAEYLIDSKRYEQYCENKAKPKLHCNGKCQLAKKIQAAENDVPQPDKTNLNTKTELPEFSPRHAGFLLQPIEVAATSTLHPTIMDMLHAGIVPGIFHPPCA